MVKSSTRLALVILVFASACAGPNPVHDLAKNDDMYLDTGYRATRPLSRTAFVKPLADRRTRLVDNTAYPRSYTDDTFWDRPVCDMLDDLVQREIRAAGIFDRICDLACNADWLVEPVLLDFHGFVEERPVGRRTHGKVALFVRVLGKPDDTGKREVLRAVRFEAPASSRNRFVVANPYMLATAAFRKAMGLMLADLEDGGRILDASAGDAPAIDVNAAPTPWTRNPQTSEAPVPGLRRR